MIVWAFGGRLALGDLELHDIPRSVVEELRCACRAVWRDGRAQTRLGGYGWAYKLWGQKDGTANG